MHPLGKEEGCGFESRSQLSFAVVAQSVEQRFRKAQVASSILADGFFADTQWMCTCTALDECCACYAQSCGGS